MSYVDFKARAVKSGATKSLEAKSSSALADGLSEVLKGMGRSEAEYDVAKALESKSAMLETKANEIMHTTNTGFGAELVPGNILMTDFLDMAPKVSPLLNFFQAGYHGRNMDKKMDVPVIGELPLHQLMPEQTTGAFAFAQGLGMLPTAKVTIEQKER